MIDRMLIEGLYVRLSDWPKEATAELWAAMDEIERRHNLIYQLDDDEVAELEIALKEVEEGLFATDAEVEAVFNKCRQPPDRV